MSGWRAYTDLLLKDDHGCSEHSAIVGHDAYAAIWATSTKDKVEAKFQLCAKEETKKLAAAFKDTGHPPLELVVSGIKYTVTSCEAKKIVGRLATGGGVVLCMSKRAIMLATWSTDAEHALAAVTKQVMFVAEDLMKKGF